jgi:hypothetical protein
MDRGADCRECREDMYHADDQMMKLGHRTVDLPLRRRRYCVLVERLRHDFYTAAAYLNQQIYGPRNYRMSHEFADISGPSGQPGTRDCCRCGPRPCADRLLRLNPSVMGSIAIGPGHHAPGRIQSRWSGRRGCRCGCGRRLGRGRSRRGVPLYGHGSCECMINIGYEFLEAAVAVAEMIGHDLAFAIDQK